MDSLHLILLTVNEGKMRWYEIKTLYENSTANIAMNSYALIIPMFIIHHKMILINSSKQEQSKYGPLKKRYDQA